MRAVWYDRQGPANDVLVCGELPTPEPGSYEVRVTLEEPIAWKVKPRPLPVSAIWMGLSNEELDMVRVPESIPGAEGENTTCTEQFDPVGSDDGHD